MITEFEANLLFVSFLLIFAALISCFETSVTAVSRARIHRLAREGNKRARILESLLEQREKVVGVMLVANNVVNIAASAITTKVVIDIFGDDWLLLATAILTVVIIVFGEILPKTVAIKFSEKVALFFAPTIKFLFFIFSPVIVLIHKIVAVPIRFIGSEPKTKESEIEEIRDTVDLKAKEGAIVKYDKDMLDGVLDLSDTEISEIMVHRKDISSLSIESPICDIVDFSIKTDFTRIPLWKGSKENIVAVLNVKRFLKELQNYDKKLEDFDLSLATSQPWFVPSSVSLRSQLFAFRKKKKRFALVIDEYGSLLGMITLEDILEEIVGEIREEDNEKEATIIKVKSGAYKIAGKALIRDINKKLGLNLKETDDAYNLSAYVISNLGRIPEENESFAINKIIFQVIKKRGHNLLWLKCKKS